MSKLLLIVLVTAQKLKRGELLAHQRMAAFEDAGAARASILR
jgi:hypothetical protein